jgi:hypothetical protein
MMKITRGLIVSGILSLATSLGRAQSTDSLDFSFTISLTDYLGASGQLYEYEIFRDSLRISYDCDFVNCQRKVIYRQMIGGVFGERFIQFLSELRIDTLRSRYSAPGFDGLVRAVVTQRNSEQPRCVLLERFHHPTIDALVKEINTLIDDEKFRIRR